MNEKTARQIAEMKNQTIGVEVEMNSITRQKGSEGCRRLLRTGRYENTAGRNGYSTWSAWDAQGREWKFQKDVSIAGPDEQKCELVTPILTYGDIETLQELCRQLRHAGAKSDASRGCGVHIHIGANGHTPQTLRNLANIMASHEELIAEALKLDRSRMDRYCRTVDPRFLEQVNRRKPQARWPSSRISGTTATAQTTAETTTTTTAATICSTSTPPLPKERSSLGSSSSMSRPQNAGAASTRGSSRATSSFAWRLSQMAKDVRTASPKPQQNENPKYAMRTWLLRLGFIGEEFATARDFLTRNLSGDTAFQARQSRRLKDLG